MHHIQRSVEGLLFSLNEPKANFIGAKWSFKNDGQQNRTSWAY